MLMSVFAPCSCVLFLDESKTILIWDLLEDMLRFTIDKKRVNLSFKTGYFSEDNTTIFKMSFDFNKDKYLMLRILPPNERLISHEINEFLN